MELVEQLPQAMSAVSANAALKQKRDAATSIADFNLL
jgi:hypothetical protein